MYKKTGVHISIYKPYINIQHFIYPLVTDISVTNSFWYSRNLEIRKRLERRTK